MAIYYSYDEETFNYDSVDEAVEAFIEHDDSIKVGDIISVQSGESVIIDVRGYVPDIMEHISESSYDDMGEFSDSFPDASVEVMKEIQKEVEDLVAKLFDKHDLNPAFYRIKNEKTIDIIINSLDEISFDILTKQQELS